MELLNMNVNGKFHTNDQLFSDMINAGEYWCGRSMLRSLVHGKNIFIEGGCFKNQNSNTLTADLNANWEEIRFKDCEFDNELVFNGTVRNIIFENVTFSKSFQFKCSCENITIINSLVAFTLTIEGAVPKSITLTDVNLVNMDVQYGSEHIALQKVFSEKSIDLKGSIAIMHFTQVKCLCLMLNLVNTSLCNIRSDSVINTISFYGTESLADIHIGDSTFDNLDLSLLNSNRSVTISNCKVVYALKINFQQAIKRIVIKNRCNINVLNVYGTIANDAIFRITETAFKKITFEDFRNYGSFTFSEVNLDKTAEFTIRHSNLGKAEFHNNSFENVKFDFTKAVINEIFISGTDFPAKIYSEGRIDYAQAKLAFGQLQTVFQKQGDSVRSYEYLSREIKAHYQNQKWSRKNLFTMLNLWLNKVSNDFGRNWAQGFLFSFGVGLLFFYLLILSSHEFTFSFPITIDWNYTASFFKFMNPLRHFETESLFKTGEDKKLHITLTNLSYAIDFFGRVLIAYGYYQTIQAFRKFGRK